MHGSAVTRFRYLATNTVRDGLMETGRWQPAALPPGEYIVRASVRDYSGNEGIGPREIRCGCCHSRSRGAAAFALGVHVFQRPHLDAAEACPREVAGDAHGFVAVARDDQVEAGQQLAGFGERAIEHAAVSIAHAQGLCGIDRLQLWAASSVPSACSWSACARQSRISALNSSVGSACSRAGSI